MENLTTLLTNPNFLAAAAIGIVLGLIVIWAVSDRYFKNDRRLFELRRELRDDRQIREHLLSRLYNLEERVDRLEDPLGKRKRGAGIYAWDRHEAIPGLSALEGLRGYLQDERELEQQYNLRVEDLQRSAQRIWVSGSIPIEGETTASQIHFTLGPDGELRKEDAHE